MSYNYQEKMLDENSKRIGLQVLSEITNGIRSFSVPSASKNILAGYLLYKVTLTKSEKTFSYEDIKNGSVNIKEEVMMEIDQNLGKKGWKILEPLTQKYSSHDFALSIILADWSAYGFNDAMRITPSSITNLAKAILNISNDDRVMDLCCGYGTFLNDVANFNLNGAKLKGCEINHTCKVVADIQSEIMGHNIEIELKDAFALLNYDNKQSFDKIFSNYPFGMKLRNLSPSSDFIEQLSKDYPGLSKATSSDWVFNALICELLSENGKAVGIMTNGSTWNTIDTPIRKYFIENGLIEAVIALPKKMFYGTMIPTTMIVLSHGNKNVRFIDASDICNEGRRINEFSDENISQIMKSMSEDNDYSKIICIEDMRKNEYVLSLSRYMINKNSIKNAAPLSSVIKNISRGAPCTAKQLDDMVSDNITNMQYLMLANIQDGVIDNNLPYLSHIEPNFEKYCLKNNDLILSKNGYPYKIAVASIKDGQKILANGNLYIIELDEQKINPYYLKAFFESEQGEASLKSITVGAVIPNIGIDKLKNLNIPVPPMHEQERIVKKYQCTMDEIAVLKLKTEKAINRLHHIFNEESED